MSKNRYVNTHFWDDAYIVGLDPIEKLLFLYFLTNPLTNIAGAYEITLRRVAFDTGIDSEMIQKILDRFAAADKMVFRNGWILISNFIKNQSLSPKIIKGIEDSVKCCPCWVKDTLSIRYQRLSHLNSIKSNLNLNPKAESADTTTLPETGFGTPFAALTSAAVNSGSKAVLDDWLDSVASVVGAKSRHTMADFEKWESVCIKAIDDGKPLDGFIKTVRAELKRNEGQMQYFSPNSVWKVFQSSSIPPTVTTNEKPILKCPLQCTNGMLKDGNGWRKCSHIALPTVMPQLQNQITETGVITR